MTNRTNQCVIDVDEDDLVHAVILDQASGYELIRARTARMNEFSVEHVAGMGDA